VDFAFDEQQRQLRTTARALLASCSSPERVRAAMGEEHGFLRDVWRRIAGELGWTALVVPEAYGGAGLGFVDLAVILEEAGRALLAAPFFSTVCLAANALALAGDAPVVAEHLGAIASGDTTATLAWMERGGRGDANGVAAVAKPDGGDFVISGEKTHVLDATAADLAIVAARAPGSSGERGIDLFAVPTGAPGVERVLLPTMDATRRLGTLRLDGVRVPGSSRLGVPGEGSSLLRRTLDRAAVALAAEQLGGAERCLEMAVEYAKVRVQFNRPIGSFQAIKHKCADMLVLVESARSAAYEAAWTAEKSPGELAVAASIAKAYASDAYFRCAAENIQIHGGIGFTAEHDAHLHFKRARASRVLLGAPAEHRERIAQHIGL
jgi:alkylation response protein AidB-like acyl-CoA dehydrogenase